MKTKRLSKEEGKRVNISRFPNFHKSGSITGMKNCIMARMPYLSVVATGYTMCQASPKYTTWHIKSHSIDHALWNMHGLYTIERFYIIKRLFYSDITELYSYILKLIQSKFR